MLDPVQIRMGGYGPPSTTHSRALKLIGDRLEARFGAAVDVKYLWNVMDFGYRADDVLWMAEHGILTLAYQSTSYLTDRVPELGFLDLPFLFADLDQARRAMDGALGQRMTDAIEERIAGYRMLGYFENGFRHLSNRLRPVHVPADLSGMRIRMLPSAVHRRTFELLGAEPVSCDLSEAIERIISGDFDAQENPLANTVTYRVHELHRYHTLTHHFYLSRGLHANRAQIDSWPQALRSAILSASREAILAQRDMAVEEEKVARRTIEAARCVIVEPDARQREVFVEAVRPLYAETRSRLGEELFALLRQS